MVSKRGNWRTALVLLASLALAAPAAADPLRGFAGLDTQGVWERAWSWVVDAWSAVGNAGGVGEKRAATAKHGGGIDPNGGPAATAPPGSKEDATTQGDHGMGIDPNG